jgi:hypothetical protein
LVHVNAADLASTDPTVTVDVFADVLLEALEESDYKLLLLHHLVLELANAFLE